MHMTLPFAMYPIPARVAWSATWRSALFSPWRISEAVTVKSLAPADAASGTPPPLSPRGRWQVRPAESPERWESAWWWLA